MSNIFLVRRYEYFKILTSYNRAFIGKYKKLLLIYASINLSKHNMLYEVDPKTKPKYKLDYCQ